MKSFGSGMAGITYCGNVPSLTSRTTLAAVANLESTSNANNSTGETCPFLNSLESLPSPPNTRLPWYKWPFTMRLDHPGIQQDIVDGKPVVQGPFRGIYGVFAATADLAKQVLNSEGTDTEPAMLPSMCKQALFLITSNCPVVCFSDSCSKQCVVYQLPLM